MRAAVTVAVCTIVSVVVVRTVEVLRAMLLSVDHLVL
jgi:hypothetical protein